MEKNEQRPPSMYEYLALAIAVAGLSVPLAVYMLLKDASNDVKLVLVGGVCFGLFAILYRLIESRVQISKEKAEAYRDAVAIARDVYRDRGSQAAPSPIAYIPDFERMLEKE